MGEGFLPLGFGTSKRFIGSGFRRDFRFMVYLDSTLPLPCLEDFWIELRLSRRSKFFLLGAKDGLLIGKYKCSIGVSFTVGSYCGKSFETPLSFASALGLFLKSSRLLSLLCLWVRGRVSVRWLYILFISLSSLTFVSLDFGRLGPSCLCCRFRVCSMLN